MLVIVEEQGQGEERKQMEREFESKLRLQRNNGGSGSSSIAFRAPQEDFSVGDFDLGKIYGVGSYSKVCLEF